jgi:protein-S-isoprenylcysteine O-methyltransferase Ste14
MPLWLARTLAVACYLAALAGAGLFGLFVLGSGLDLWPGPRLFSSGFPWLIDAGWLVLFGVQHSVMARESFKRAWTRIVPSWLERSIYAALSGVLVGIVPFVWQPLPGGPLWRLPLGLVVVPLLAALGVSLVNLSQDHPELFGLRQAWHPDATSEPEKLIVTGPYRFVRHPLAACVLVFLWAQPVMRPGLTLLAAGLSGYIALGIVLEERDLARRFGPDYDRYRRRVPRLVPLLWCLVFRVWCLAARGGTTAGATTHETPNTKHQTPEIEERA